jgi:hypothetical protein
MLEIQTLRSKNFGLDYRLPPCDPDQKKWFEA